MTPTPKPFLCSTCAVLAATAGALVGCQEAPKDPAPLVRSVRYVVVQKTEETGARTFSGALQAGNQSQLSFQVSGRIRSLPVKTGRRVTKGQLIASLDPTDFELQLREAKANLAQARAQANNADANYQRVRRLYETRNTSRQELDAARTSRDTARSAQVAAQETVQRIKRQLEYTTLEAPAAGRVNDVMAEVNEVVTAGKPVVVLQAGQELEATIDVPESFVRLTSIGDKARVMIGALNSAVEGVVQEIGVSQGGTGVFPVTIKLDVDPANARPGMVAEVTLTPKKDLTPVTDGFKVPLTAIGEDRDGRFVFRVEGEPGGEGKVVRQAIETGRLTANGIYVTEGISEGQRIVTAGVSRIQDGLTVRVPESESRGEAL